MLKDALDNWVDLHHHSAYSPLDGVPFPTAIVEKAAQLGRPAVALTDHGSVSGHVLFEKAIEGFTQQSIGSSTMFRRDGTKLAIKPIFGTEAYITRDVEQPEQKKNHITILAASATGYHNLIALVSDSYERGFYYRPTIDPTMLARYRDGLIVLSGCESSSFLRSVANGDLDAAYNKAMAMRYYLGDAFCIELQHFPHMRDVTLDAFRVAEGAGIRSILTCDVHYLEDADKHEQQLLYAIRDKKPVAEMDFCMHHAYPWEPDALYAHVRAHLPELPWERILYDTAALAAGTDDYRLPRAPHVLFPMEGDKIAYVRDTCLRYLQERGKADDPEYLARLDRELNIIADKEYVDYFLVVADMITWAKRNGIFVGPARGSAAGSLVCWGLRIIEIDPIEWGLIFERFVDPSRVDLPDIDVDFEDERRWEVLEYLRSKYGAENVANIATFHRFGGRSTLDDLARAFRIPSWAIDTVKRNLVERSSGDQRAEFTIQDTLENGEAAQVFKQFPELGYATNIQGKIRGTGKHASGVIVTSEPIRNYMAIYKNAATGDTMVGVDWRDAAYLNLMKIDVLGLKELAIIGRIAQRVGLTLDDVYRIPLDDAATIQVFNDKNYLGIFQFEGPAVRLIAERLHFKSLRDIADVNALARPGPLHAGATEKYILGHQTGLYQSVITHPSVLPFLEQTYGQIIYQETVMRILRDIGGLSWQDVCDIRNIMGKSKGSEAFDSYWPKWYAGVVSSGRMSERDARQIWDCIKMYGKHSFNAAHAFAYGLLAYWSAYLKAHYSREYYWARLCKSNERDETQRTIREALRNGIEFAPVSLDMQNVDWDIDAQGRIAPGWSVLSGIGSAFADRIIAAAPFVDTADLVKRVKGVGKVKGAAIAEQLGRTVNDIFELDFWERMSAWYPQRMPINALPSGNEGWIIGKVTEVNKKSRMEEWKIKGKDISKLRANEPDTYASITVRDDTTSIRVYVSPRLYVLRQELIWNNPNGYLAAYGSRPHGMPVFMAKDIGLIEIGDNVPVPLAAD